jgi:hypothetical protein
MQGIVVTAWQQQQQLAVSWGTSALLAAMYMAQAT